jgi:hypothetical protein
MNSNSNSEMNNFSLKLPPPHGIWFDNPTWIFVVLVAIASLLIASSWLLGIAWGEKSNRTGFLDAENWIAMLILAPVAGVTVPPFFWSFQNAIQSLDKILIPKEDTSALLLSERYRRIFEQDARRWIVPLSLGIVAVFTIVGDGREILSPLHLIDCPLHKQSDWMCATYWQQTPSLSRQVALAGFNFITFLWEIFVYYSGILILLICLHMVFSFSIFQPEKKRLTSRYQLRWDYCDASGRCGLKDFDKVYILFLIMMSLALLGANAGVSSNIRLNNPNDIGSWGVVIFTMIGLPITLVWLLVPYWTSFPKGVPETKKKECIDQHGLCPDPSPWPVGQRFAQISLVFIVSTWLAMLPKNWSVIQTLIQAVLQKAS